MVIDFIQQGEGLMPFSFGSLVYRHLKASTPLLKKLIGLHNHFTKKEMALDSDSSPVAFYL